MPFRWEEDVESVELWGLAKLENLAGFATRRIACVARWCAWTRSMCSVQANELVVVEWIEVVKYVYSKIKLIEGVISRSYAEINVG